MGLLVLLISWLLLPSSVSAHASLVSVVPVDGSRLDTAPTEIILTFSEPVGMVDGGTSLHSGDTDPVVLTPHPSGDQVVIPLDIPLADGAWVVQWRVISTDSHPIAGTVSFTVGDADPAANGDLVTDLPGWVSISQSIAVAAKYLGLLAAIGVWIVSRIIAPRDVAARMRVTGSFAILGLTGLFSELPFTAIEQRGSVPPNVGALVDYIAALDSSTRTASVIGLVLVAIGIIALWKGQRNLSGWTTTTALFAASLLTQLLTGHTRTTTPEWLMMTADAVHLLVAALWLGGIILLALGLSGRWQGEAFSSTQASISSVSKFSAIAAYMALLVIGSGVAMAITILRTPEALFGTNYGTTLFIKIGAVALVIALAAVNRYILIPRLPASASTSLAWLKRLVLGELVLLLAVVGFTAHLVQQDPTLHTDSPKDSGAVVYQGDHALDDGHNITLTITRQSGNELEVRAILRDDSGAPVILDSDLGLEWNLPAQNLGPISSALSFDSHAGDYRGVITLPIEGTWNLTIRASLDRFTDSRATIEIMFGGD